ncbi:MAG: hypothetical protein DME97_09345, partial [Verrucomicrobia bacterium]
MEGSPEIEDLVTQAFDYADRNDFARAQSLALRVLQSDPKNAGALYLSAFCLRQLGRSVEAEKAVKNALKLLPDNVVLLLERGFAEYERQEYEKAIESFDTVLKHEPKNVDALKWKIASFRGLRRFDDAKASAEIALKLVPDNASILVEAGIADYGREQYDKAIEFFDTA